MAATRAPGWQQDPHLASTFVEITRALAECTTAQGSQLRPSLLAAAEAGGSEEVTVALREAFTRESCQGPPIPPAAAATCARLAQLGQSARPLAGGRGIGVGLHRKR